MANLFAGDKKYVQVDVEFVYTWYPLMCYTSYRNEQIDDTPTTLKHFSEWNIQTYTCVGL